MPGFQIIALITAEIFLDSGDHVYSLTFHCLHQIARTLKKVYEPSWSRTCSNGDLTRQEDWKAHDGAPWRQNDEKMSRKNGNAKSRVTLFRHSAVMSLLAALLCKVSNISSHRSDCMETKHTFTLIRNSLVSNGNRVKFQGINFIFFSFSSGENYNFSSERPSVGFCYLPALVISRTRN